jgi:hypothetical protein
VFQEGLRASAKSKKHRKESNELIVGGNVRNF